MITDSSKNYLDNTLTLVYDGDDVSVQEILDYCEKCYQVTPDTFVIDPPSTGFGGYPNPGIVKVQLPW